MMQDQGAVFGVRVTMTFWKGGLADSLGNENRGPEADLHFLNPADQPPLLNSGDCRCK